MVTALAHHRDPSLARTNTAVSSERCNAARGRASGKIVVELLSPLELRWRATSRVVFV